MKTKFCTKCSTHKQLNNFSMDSRRLDGKQQHCKSCVKVYMTIRQQRHREDPIYRERRNLSRKRTATIRKSDKKLFVKEAKNKPCLDCGNKYLPIQMDFDHRDPTQKLDNISSMVGDNYTLESLKVEIAKCDLVCANCHRLREYKRSLDGTLSGLESTI